MTPNHSAATALSFHTEALTLLESDAPPAVALASEFPQGLPLDLGALERLAIAEALRRTRGNRTHAARLLGIGLRTLRNRLREERLRAARPLAACPSQGGFGP